MQTSHLALMTSWLFCLSHLGWPASSATPCSSTFYTGFVYRCLDIPAFSVYLFCRSSRCRNRAAGQSWGFFGLLKANKYIGPEISPLWNARGMRQTTNLGVYPHGTFKNKGNNSAEGGGKNWSCLCNYSKDEGIRKVNVAP